VLTAENHAPVDGATLWGTAEEITDNDGKFSLKLCEGLNYICINPNTSEHSTYEFKCFYDIPVSRDDF
jgi:hypothetical protein